MDVSETGFVNLAPPPDAWCRDGSDESDEILMQAVVRRCPEALCWLYARYEGLVVSVAREILLDQNDAQETLQDVFLEIWNHAGRFDARRGKFKGWLHTLTRCRAIDRCRRRRREAVGREKVREEFARNVTEHFYQFDRAAYFSEAGDDGRAVLLDAVASLPSEQAQALHLTYMTGMSQREIAKHLGVTLGVVKHRLNKAMRAMTKLSDRLRGVFAD